MSSGFAAFLLRRILSAVVFVAVVSTAALVLVRLVPGNATIQLKLLHADPATIAVAASRLQLDRPIYEQVGGWLLGLTRLDLGSSIEGRPVREMVGERAANTAQLATVALVLATLIGLPVGVLTGLRPRGVFARVVTPISIALVACPPIVGALGLLLLAVRTGWLSVSPGSLAVPALALALPLAAMLERLQAQSIGEALASPDITAAAARGLPRWRLVWVHAWRQSLRPVLGIYGIVIGSLFGGSLAVEWVTNWPGLGRLTLRALEDRDVLLSTGCVFFGAVLISLANIAADAARTVVDPRART